MMQPRPIRHDDVCLVCDKWTENALDKLSEWQECAQCVQAYHKKCIPSNNRWSRRNSTCTQYFAGSRTRNGIEYRCCPPREPQLLCDTQERPFQIEYYQIIDGKQTVGIPKHARNPHQKLFFLSICCVSNVQLHACSDIIDAKNIRM